MEHARPMGGGRRGMWEASKEVPEKKFPNHTARRKEVELSTAPVERKRKKRPGKRRVQKGGLSVEPGRPHVSTGTNSMAW